MEQTTWTVMGDKAELRIAEFRIEPDANASLKTYQEAKEEALRKLKEHIAPYLTRIEELEADQFKEKGHLPELKAWERDGYRTDDTLVVAKTKKRAAELVGESRYGFNVSYTEASGDWWYPYAAEEGTWSQRGAESGVYMRALGRELASSLLNAAIEPYLTMPLSELGTLVGQTVCSEGVSTHGTPYQVRIEIVRSLWGEPCINMRGELTDHLASISNAVRFEKRSLPLSIDHTGEGF